MLQETVEFNEGCFIWQQDGAPSHWYRPARLWLDQNFGQRWIGRNGPMAWPARSPDLTACDDWLLGHLKHLVYQTEPQNFEDLKRKICDAFQGITDDQRLRAIADFDRRVRLFLERKGDYVEN